MGKTTQSASFFSGGMLSSKKEQVSPLAEKKRSTRSRRRILPQKQKQQLALTGLVALVLVAAVFAFALHAQLARRTLPERVQAHMPAWVTQELLTPNEYSRPQTPVKQVNAIVVHYVGNPGTSAAANRSYFEGLAASGETYASANFVVGLDGEILQCVPVSEVAYCSSDRNYDTVSIEVCHPDAEGRFNDVTMDSLVRLTAWLCQEFGLDPQRDVIRHYDVTGKECPVYYVRNPDAWQAFKEQVQSAVEATRQSNQ